MDFKNAKNIVFDIGGVLADYRIKEFLSEKGFDGNMIKRIIKASVMSPYWGMFERNEIGEEEALKGFAEQDPEIDNELRMAFSDVSGLLTIREYSIPLIKKIKKLGYGVYYLSNYSKKAFEECKESLAFMEYMDGGMVSFKAGITKPDPKIYDKFLEEYDLKAEECVFIDDTQENVEAAEKLGFTGIVFTSFEDLEKKLLLITERRYDMENCYRINEKTWRIEDNGVRMYLFCGTEKAALIDTGMNKKDARKIAEGLTDLPVILINTHADPDHISGNGAFESFYMSPNEEENYRSHNGEGKLIPVSEGDVIDLGERKLEVIDIPGHTPGSIAILDKKYKVLVSGDSIQDGRIFMFGKGRDIDRYIESMKHLKEYDGLYDEIYPMHGTFPVGPDLLPKLIEGAEKIKAGSAVATPVELFGNEVRFFKFDYAGFLCDK